MTYLVQFRLIPISNMAWVESRRFTGWFARWRARSWCNRMSRFPGCWRVVREGDAMNESTWLGLLDKGEENARKCKEFLADIRRRKSGLAAEAPTAIAALTEIAAPDGGEFMAEQPDGKRILVVPYRAVAWRMDMADRVLDEIADAP